MIEEAVTGSALLIENAALAQAGIDKQPETQGQITLAGEIIDGLRATVFFERKIILREVRDNFAVLVMNRREHAYRAHLHSDFGIATLLRLSCFRRRLRLRRWRSLR